MSWLMIAAIGGGLFLEIFFPFMIIILISIGFTGAVSTRACR